MIRNEKKEKMITFALSFLGILAGTLIPVYVALLLIPAIGERVPVRYISAFGLGIVFFFYVDVMFDSTELGVNSGFSGGLYQLGLVASFIAGLIVLTGFDHYAFPKIFENNGGNNLSISSSVSRLAFL